MLSHRYVVYNTCSQINIIVNIYRYRQYWDTDSWSWIIHIKAWQRMTHFPWWCNHHVMVCHWAWSTVFQVILLMTSCLMHGYSLIILTGWGHHHDHLTHWAMHICVRSLTVIGSDNGLSPGRHQTIIWTNAWISSTGPLGTNFNEILIQIHTFSFMKMHLKRSSAKWPPFCLGLNVYVFWVIGKLGPYFGKFQPLIFIFT